MNTFRIWLEDFESEKARKVQDIWHDAFQTLGVGGLSDEDAILQSLSNLNYGRRDDNGDNNNTIKGKKAAIKRLENGQIFQRLLDLQDPEITKNVHRAKEWLGQQSDKQNADTTVATLMKILFGDNYQKLVDSDVPDVGGGKLTKAEPQPPKNGTEQPSMGQEPEQEPMQQYDMQSPGQQPQLDRQPPKMKPTNPMAPKPMGM